MNKGLINSEGILYRKKSLPKNTRIVRKQIQSLAIVDGVELSGKKVLIVDDVVTSGSSLKAGMKVIGTLKPGQISALALARKVFLKDIPLDSII